MKSDLIDITMQIHQRTDRAVLASDDGERESAVWLPLSHVDITPKGKWFEITMPEWLAFEKGLA